MLNQNLNMEHLIKRLTDSVVFAEKGLYSGFIHRFDSLRVIVIKKNPFLLPDQGSAAFLPSANAVHLNHS